LWLDPITFGPDYLVDRYRFRRIAYRRGRKIVVDVSRQALGDTGASITERHALFGISAQNRLCGRFAAQPSALIAS
jgi:hypothetical protein